MRTIMITAATTLLAVSGMANAAFVASTGNDVQVRLDNLGATLDVNADQIPDSADSQWMLAGPGTSYTFTIILELAGKSRVNTFGIYDTSDPGNYIELFTGLDSASAQTSLSIAADGSVFIAGADTGKDLSGQQFGYYLGRPAPLFFSDSSLNPGNADQMAAFRGNDSDSLTLPSPLGNTLFRSRDFIVAFEDLPYASSDKDLNDLVLFIQSAREVPAPGSLALLGLGLSCLGVIRLRKT